MKSPCRFELRLDGAPVGSREEHRVLLDAEEALHCEDGTDVLALVAMALLRLLGSQCAPTHGLEAICWTRSRSVSLV